MPRPPYRPPPLPHAAAYKAMYGHRQAILDLCRYLVVPNGPLDSETLAALDYSTLTNPWLIRFANCSFSFATTVSSPAIPVISRALSGSVVLCSALAAANCTSLRIPLCQDD